MAKIFTQSNYSFALHAKKKMKQDDEEHDDDNDFAACIQIFCNFI